MRQTPNKTRLWAALADTVFAVIATAFPGLGAKSLDVGRAEAGHNAGMTGGVRIDAELGLASSSRSGSRRA